MARNDLMTLITERYAKLTKSERKVADMVLHDPQEVLQATITDLAEMCGVGDTTVFRFCRSLKLNGYQDFKLSLALSTNGRSVSEPRGSEMGLAGNGTVEQLFQDVHEAYVQTLEDTMKSLGPDAVTRAVDLMEAATAIHLFGVGSSGHSAQGFLYKFARITPKISFNPESHNQLITAALLEEGALAIIFSNSGTTKDCIECARLAKAGGAKVIFATKFAKTPALRYTDVLLLCGAVEGPMQGGSIASRTSQAYLVDLLYAEFFRRMGEQATINKQKTSAAIASQML